MVGISDARPIVRTIPSLFLAGEACTSRVALIDCGGAFAGFVGTGIAAMAAVQIPCVAPILSLWHMMQDSASSVVRGRD